MSKVPYSINNPDIGAKRPRSGFTAASRGNQSMKRRTHPDKNRMSCSSSSDANDKMKMLDLLSQMKSGCTCSLKKKQACCYVNNWGLNCDTLTHCREVYYGLETDEEIRQRKHEIMRSAAPEVVMTQGKSGKKTKMQFSYEVKDKSVCRKTFCLLYNISDHQLRVFSDRVKNKEGNNLFVSHEKVVKLKDEDVPDMSFNEMIETYEDNLQSAAGAIIFINIKLLYMSVMYFAIYQQMKKFAVWLVYPTMIHPCLL